MEPSSLWQIRQRTGPVSVTRAALRRRQRVRSPTCLPCCWSKSAPMPLWGPFPLWGAVGESRLARGLLGSIHQGMLVLLDRGFFSAAFVRDVQARHAHILVRLASNRLLGTGQPLRDGSVLLTLTPQQYPDLQEPLIVRLISYRLHPQAVDLLKQVTPSHSQHGSGTHNPKVREVHRLVTTLLDPES